MVKGFSEWLVESKVTRTESTNTSYFLGREIQFYFQPGELAQILEGTVLNLWVHQPRSEGQAWSLLKKIAKSTGVEITPILENLQDNRYDSSIYGRPDLIFFSVDPNLGKEFLTQAQAAIRAAGQARTISVPTKGLFVEYILGNPDLTPEDLIALLEFANDEETITAANEMIKSHPNWPEDMTDWALGDW